MINLKPFQEQAVSNLRKSFLDLWKTENRKRELVFKAPTGSGKTVMVAQLLKDLSSDPQFAAEKAYIWISFSEDSYDQSKLKLLEYYGGSSEIGLHAPSDLKPRMSLNNNDVFFINWQKIKAENKQGKILRKPDERSPVEGLFDELVHTTRKHREIILIVDEAHRDSDTVLADEIIELVDPRIIVKITATPKEIPDASDVQHHRKGFVEIEREEVVSAGLIKEKILTQTKEDLLRKNKEVDQNKLLLELAFQKRKELLAAYKKASIKINPLVLIQLPNDQAITKNTGQDTMAEITNAFLIKQGLSEKEIAWWLSDKKENLAEITKPDSKIAFLLFKQAAATGWDCPRASILVMFREIKSPIFHVQTLGRILRMPEGKHYPQSELNQGYLYTNYARNQIQLPDYQKKNYKLALNTSYLKKGITAKKVQTCIMGRTDYNDLGDTFQKTFTQIANEYFTTPSTITPNKFGSILEKAGIETRNIKIENKLIADAQIEDYDNFVKEIQKKGLDISKETSWNDLERLYNLLCYRSMVHQSDPNKYGPERSWGKLKTALNLWFSEHLCESDRKKYYPVIVKALLTETSKLHSVIAHSLESYRSIRDEEVHHKASRAKKIAPLELPPKSISFTDDFEDIYISENLKLARCAVAPFFFRKSYAGRNNELDFIKYLESKGGKIKWWYKNGDNGSEHFAMPYFDKDAHKERLFYPDWIVLCKNNKLFFLDTKKGVTAAEQHATFKSDALQTWLRTQKNFDGGIVERDERDNRKVWRIFRGQKYSRNSTFKGWEELDVVLGK